MAGKANDDTRTGERGNFFAVHREMWDIICQQAGMNEAVAYLVLARGSHFGTRLTSWSVDAIERYTAISRGRAKEAMASLIAAGLIVRTRGRTKPQYYLPTEHEFVSVYAPSTGLSEAERGIFDRVRNSKGPLAIVADEIALADELERRWVFSDAGEGRYVVNPDLSVVEASAWIWLPNSLVDGVDGRAGPVDQIRQTQDRMALRLFVDLYYWQSLASNGGLHWRMIREEYERDRVGQSGPYEVWGFRSAGVVMWDTAPFVEPYLTGERMAEEGPDGITSDYDTGSRKVWATLAKLKGLGLIQFVPHLIDIDTDQGEVIHPCPVSNGVPEERAVTEAALNAAHRLVTDGQERFADSKGYAPIVPIPRHLDNAVLVGLLRLTHRARTTATAKWMKNASDWAKWEADYNRIGINA